jgi:Holliday junction resolvase RusA-like endonuclease
VHGALVAAVIRFFVGGTPKSMKVSGVAPFMRGGKQHFVPKRGNDEWVTLVGRIGRDHAPERLIDGPLIFVAKFYLQKPTTLPRKFTMTALPTKRPDLDNLVHKMTDQFNGVFWRDDSQIVDVLARKRYSHDGRTGVEITVAPVTNMQLQAELDQAFLDLEPSRA